MTETPGSTAFYTLSSTMDNLKQYQGVYVCYASNELGTAVSNAATLITDGKTLICPTATGLDFDSRSVAVISEFRCFHHQFSIKIFGFCSFLEVMEKHLLSV